MSPDRPSWIDPREYPFDSHYFTTPAGRMHYLDEGQGPPIVFAHGNPAWSFEFRNLIKALAPTHRCIAADLLGFGLSDKPWEFDYLPIHQAANLALLLDSLDLRDATIYGQDWGGPTGFSWALGHPERVRALVASNTWLWSVQHDWYYKAFSGFVGGPLGRYLIRHRNFFARRVMRMAYGDKRRLTPEIHAHYLNTLPTQQDRKGCWVFPGQVVGSSEWLASLWAQRSKLKGKRMLLAWGMKDIAFREKELDTWRAEFPDARVVRYPDAGHYVAEEKPAELAAEIASLLNG
jgi:haloalkane dehalogenase